MLEPVEAVSVTEHTREPRSRQGRQSAGDWPDRLAGALVAAPVRLSPGRRTSPPRRPCAARWHAVLAGEGGGRDSRLGV